MSESGITPASSVARRTAPAAAAACALLCGAGALAQERNRLLGVEAGGDAGASSVVLIADRPLSFTTLKLSAPPRVVVDLADTELSGAPRDLSVEDGTIRRVAAAPAGQRTARVVIELAGEAEFDVRAEGNRLQVRVPRIAGTAAPQPAPKEPLAAASPPAAGPQGPGGSAEAPSHPATSSVQAEAKAPAEPTPAPAATEPPPDPAPQPAETAEPAGAVAAGGEAGDAARAAAREKALERAAAAVRASRQRVLAAAARRSAPAAPAHHPSASASHHSITGIGFRPVGDGEVIVRSDHPLEYGVSGEEGAVLLHLPSTAIPLANNRRALDTRFFNGAVQRVVPLAVEGGTDVRIELRGRAEYRLAQSGTVLTVTFSSSR